MAKAKKSEAGPATEAPEGKNDWQSRDDAQTAMRYAELKADSPRHKAAMNHITRTAALCDGADAERKPVRKSAGRQTSRRR